MTKIVSQQYIPQEPPIDVGTHDLNMYVVVIFLTTSVDITANQMQRQLSIFGDPRKLNIRFVEKAFIPACRHLPSYDLTVGVLDSELSEVDLALTCDLIFGTLLGLVVDMPSGWQFWHAAKTAFLAGPHKLHTEWGFHGIVLEIERSQRRCST